MNDASVLVSAGMAALGLSAGGVLFWAARIEGAGGTTAESKLLTTLGVFVGGVSASSLFSLVLFFPALFVAALAGQFPSDPGMLGRLAVLMPGVVTLLVALVLLVRVGVSSRRQGCVSLDPWPPAAVMGILVVSSLLLLLTLPVLWLRG